MSGKEENVGPFTWNQCYFIDCMEGMMQLPDQSIDLCLTDPPWETSEDGGFHTRFGKDIKGSPHIEYETHDTTWHLKWIHEASRVCKIVVFCVPLKDLNAWVKMTDPKGIFILYFKNGFRPSKISNINKYSPYFALFDEPPKHKPLFNVIEHVSEWGFIPHEKYDHPSPKSTKVFKYFIDGFKAKSVLDPFLGSGCTAEAAENIGNVKWLGFEIDEAACSNDISRRVSSGVKVKRSRKNQASLF